MARRLLKHVCTVLQSQEAQIESHSVGRIHSLSNSYCAYRYWHNIQQKFKHENNFQHVNHFQESYVSFKQHSALDVQTSVRCISQSSCYHDIRPKTSSISSVSNNKNADMKFKKKPSTKSPVKEFTIKENISDHDLSIKLTRIQSLLDKGKVIEIFIKYKTVEESEQEKNANAIRIQKKLEDNLQGIKPLKMDFSNKTTTKLIAVKVDEHDT